MDINKNYCFLIRKQNKDKEKQQQKTRQILTYSTIEKMRLKKTIFFESHKHCNFSSCLNMTVIYFNAYRHSNLSTFFSYWRRNIWKRQCSLFVFVYSPRGCVYIVIYIIGSIIFFIDSYVFFLFAKIKSVLTQGLRENWRP